MRTILFRGKDLGNGEWVESMTISQGTIKRKRDCVYLEISEGNWVGVDPTTVGQYWRTVNKVRLFEGDIFRVYWDGAHSDWVVRYSEKKAAVCIVPLYNLENEGWMDWWGWLSHVIEKLGNIHDNPELLKTE